VKVGQEAFLTQLLEVGFFHGGEPGGGGGGLVVFVFFRTGFYINVMVVGGGLGKVGRAGPASGGALRCGVLQCRGGRGLCAPPGTCLLATKVGSQPLLAGCRAALLCSCSCFSA
jgi:hypothetical protein